MDSSIAFHAGPYLFFLLRDTLMIVIINYLDFEPVRVDKFYLFENDFE